eukprot:GABV01001419.1.p1 GENE.GABV01001419.1~~GABV01001419.1.p1  ORF type:complete len:292 (+),score=110.70 GABV01001419.1:104-877(+)
MATGAALLGSIGLGALMAQGLSASNTSSLDSWTATSQDMTQQRIRSTFGYLAAGLGVTAATSVAMFRTGMAHRWMMRMAGRPWMSLIASTAVLLGSSVATQMVPYESTVPKHVAWLGFNTAMAFMLAPMGFMGGPLLLRAAMGTGAVVGSLAAVAATAPDGQFLNMRGMLGVGLGVVIGASLGTMFLPNVAFLHHVSLYGGLALFGGFVLYDTQSILTAARTMPKYDPINQSMRVYMDSVNIFVRIAQIMAGGNRRK